MCCVVLYCVVLCFDAPRSDGVVRGIHGWMDGWDCGAYVLALVFARGEGGGKGGGGKGGGGKKWVDGRARRVSRGGV